MQQPVPSWSPLRLGMPIRPNGPMCSDSRNLWRGRRKRRRDRWRWGRGKGTIARVPRDLRMLFLKIFLFGILGAEEWREKEMQNEEEKENQEEKEKEKAIEKEKEKENEREGKVKVKVE